MQSSFYNVTRALFRQALPEKVYLRFTRDHRRLTLSLPFAKIALVLGRLRFRWKSSPKGIERLDGIIVINLGTRPDRLSGFAREMERLRLTNYSRFEAISDKSGILGCTKSHAECVRQMLERSDRCIMICEDDARFLVSREQLDVLVDAFLDDPRAEVACLAYRHLCPPKPHNLLFLRAPGETHTTACYLVKSSIADDVLAVFEDGIEKLAMGGDRAFYGLDVIWARLQRSRVFLIPIKRAVYQADGYSDIEEQFVSYGGY
jgi:hypothetical protein